MTNRLRWCLLTLCVASTACSVPATSETDDNDDARACPVDLYCSILDDGIRDAHCLAAAAPECCVDDDCPAAGVCSGFVCEPRACAAHADCPGRFGDGLGPCAASSDCPDGSGCFPFEPSRCFRFSAGCFQTDFARTVEGEIEFICLAVKCDDATNTCRAVL